MRTIYVRRVTSGDYAGAYDLSCENHEMRYLYYTKQESLKLFREHIRERENERFHVVDYTKKGTHEPTLVELCMRYQNLQGGGK